VTSTRLVIHVGYTDSSVIVSDFDNLVNFFLTTYISLF
jgi:hypothetical protein